jgi:two-component system, OmpR family, response regulator
MHFMTSLCQEPSMRAFILEDNLPDVEAVRVVTDSLGATLSHAPSCADASRELNQTDFDFLVLDRMVGDGDGLDILRTARMRGMDCPAIVISVMDTVEDRIRCFEAGADDYLAKPFAPNELSARLKALFRRAQKKGEHALSVTIADLEMDLLHRTVRRGNRVLSLQAQEYKLLKYLVHRAGTIVSRDELLRNVWNYYAMQRTNIVEAHISNLRRKVDLEGYEPLIETIRGVGYRLGPTKGDD